MRYSVTSTPLARVLVLAVSAALGCGGTGGDDGSADDASADDSVDDSAADDSTPDDSTADDSTADDSTADDSTADDSTADDSTADDSTGDDSSADDAAPSDGPRSALSVEILPGCSADAQVLNYPPSSSAVVTSAGANATFTHGDPAPDSPEGYTVDVQCGIFDPAPPHLVNVQVEFGVVGEIRGFWFSVLGTPGETSTGSLMLRGAPFEEDHGVFGDELCDIKLLEVDLEARSALAELTCPSLVTSGGTDSCSIGQSYLYVENCD